MSVEDRDKKFEQALQRQLRAEPAQEQVEAESLHPDAETLGAFHERMLSDAEMHATKEHVAGCPRCQEVLSMLEATDDVPLAESQSERQLRGEIEAENVVPARASIISTGAIYQSPTEKGRRFETPPTPAELRAERKPLPTRGRAALWQAFAAMGAVAAGLLIYVTVFSPKYRSVQPTANLQAAREAARDQLTAQNGNPPTRPVSPNPGVADKPAIDDYIAPRISPAPAPVGKLRAPAQGSGAGIAAPNARSRLPLNARNVQGAIELDKSRGQDPRREGDRIAASNALAAGARAAKPAAPGTSPKEAAASTPEAATALVAPQSTGPASEEKKAAAAVQQNQAKDAAVQPGSVTQTVEVTAAEASTTQSEFKAALPDRGQIQVEATEARPPKYITVVTPDSTVSWRLARHGRIERSTDSGTHWKRQSSGTSRDLIAGAAPSSSICWVVGRAGTILRTTDGGGHWSKVASPLTEDIGQVAAADALNATISAGDKHLVTTDGGATWSSIKK
jgi:hypothetical protein